MPLWLCPSVPLHSSFRRLLQMGVYNCQLYNNLGLCCFYAQQYDMTLSSFERALALVSSDEDQADIWYNLGHVAVVGDSLVSSALVWLGCKSFQQWWSLSTAMIYIWEYLPVTLLFPGHLFNRKHSQTNKCFYLSSGNRRFDSSISVFQASFSFQQWPCWSL